LESSPFGDEISFLLLSIFVVLVGIGIEVNFAPPQTKRREREEEEACFASTHEM
jgi:hypothetical protein